MSTIALSVPAPISRQRIAQAAALAVAAASALVCPYAPMVVALAGLSWASRVSDAKR